MANFAHPLYPGAMSARIRAGITRFISNFFKHDVTTLAAALAFYTALSLAPLLLVMLSIISLLGPNAKTDFLHQARDIMGRDAFEALTLIVHNTQLHPELGRITGIIGLIVLLFSASAVFGQLQSSLNVIWESEATSEKSEWISYLRKRVFSMGMVIVLAFLAMVSLVISTALAYVWSSNTTVLHTLNIAVSILLFGGVFALVFRYLPDKQSPWNLCLRGGFFTALLFTLGKFLIGLYLGQSAIGSSYGAAGSLIVLLAWVYYSSIILFIGAEVTKTLTPWHQQRRAL